MTRRTTRGVARGVWRDQASIRSSCAGESRRYACRTTPADGPSANSASASSPRTSSAVVSSESTDSMSTCRCAPRSRARRSSGRIRAAASSRPTSGACGRISGVRAVTLTERLTRGTGPEESRSSHSRAGHRGAASASVSSASSQRAA